MIPAAPLILVVEDEPDTLAALDAILAREGFRVVKERSGTAAVEKARQQQPDLVLLDLGLPGMNGLDVAALLQRDPITAATPLIALTGSWLASEPTSLRQVGFSGAIRKPFRASELLAEVRKALLRGGRLEP